MERAATAYFLAVFAAAFFRFIFALCCLARTFFRRTCLLLLRAMRVSLALTVALLLANRRSVVKSAVRPGPARSGRRRRVQAPCALDRADSPVGGHALVVRACTPARPKLPGMEQTPTRTSHRILVGLTWLSIALTAWIIRPFWTALFVAAVVAGVLRGPMNWLTRRFRGRRRPAALLLTLGILVLVLLPLTGLGAFLVNELLDGIQWVRGVLSSQGVEGLVSRLPASLRNAGRSLVDSLPSLATQFERLPAAGGQAAAAVTTAVAATTNALFQGAAMLIALFFFLSDGRSLVAWLDTNAPLQTGQLTGLLEEFRSTARSVLWATLGTALVQTVVAAAGFLIARAPVPLFLILLTFVFALIPMVGGGFAVFAAGVFLLLSGHPIAGIFLMVWGAVVVSLVDNLARPYLLKGGMELHGGVVFFALLGGLGAFGGVGLIIGPMIVTFLMAALKLYRRDVAEQGTRVS